MFAGPPEFPQRPRPRPDGGERPGDLKHRHTSDREPGLDPTSRHRIAPTVVEDARQLTDCGVVPDDELFLFGFSRGAYTARSTAGLVRNAGILRREHADRIDEAYALYRDRKTHPRDTESRLFRRSYSLETRIRCIGVWDTVGALGIPLNGLCPVPGSVEALN